MKLSWTSSLMLFIAPGLLAHEIQISDDVKMDSGFRWRWQSVDDDNRGDAIAHTLKARISLDADLSSQLRMYVEADGVVALNQGDYNSGVFNPGTSPVPDPQGAELNQWYVDYSGFADWRIKLGRQAVAFDDERHIGRVEFWQNDQTFNALSVSYNNLQNLKVSYAYLSSAQRILGNGAGEYLSSEDVRFAANPLRPRSQWGEHQHASHLLHANYTFSRNLVLGGYAWLLDNRDLTIAASNTFGVQISGAKKPARIKYGYQLEWATQKGAYNNPWNYSADFLKLSASAQYKSHSMALTFEEYGTDNVAGFQTPLGNNHKFLGWADIFSGYRLTPGLRDHYLTYKGRKGKLRWQIVAHRFKDASGDIHVGDELDLELAYRYTRKWELKVISANYRTKSGFAALPESQFDLSSLYFSVNYNI